MSGETDTTIANDAAAGDDQAPANELSGQSETDLDADESVIDEERNDEERNGVVPDGGKRSINWSKILAYGVLPALALLLALAAGELKWQTSVDRSAGIARIESVAAAKDTTIALLSYRPETVEKDLDAARDRLTGSMKDSYTQLIRDVVIPGAKQKQITAVATVPAVASVKVTSSHAVVLLYVDQTTVIGKDAPSDSVSVVRVSLDTVRGRWLVSGFDPI